MTSEPAAWRLDITEQRGKFKWQLIHVMNPDGVHSPWIVADDGKADSPEGAAAAAHESWLRKVTSVAPGEPVPWAAPVGA